MKRKTDDRLLKELRWSIGG